jgi:hypothetical protein
MQKITYKELQKLEIEEGSVDFYCDDRSSKSAFNNRFYSLYIYISFCDNRILIRIIDFNNLKIHGLLNGLHSIKVLDNKLEIWDFTNCSENNGAGISVEGKSFEFYILEFEEPKSYYYQHLADLGFVESSIYRS